LAKSKEEKQTIAIGETGKEKVVSVEAEAAKVGKFDAKMVWKCIRGVKTSNVLEY